MASDKVELQLFYDTSCPLCCRFREWVAAHDGEGRVESWALDDPSLPERFPELDLARAAESLTVRGRDGGTYEGLAALRQLAMRLPGLRRLGWIYHLPGAQTVAGGLYRTVNRYRRQLCLRCGETWLPSRKYSQRKRGRQR